MPTAEKPQRTNGLAELPQLPFAFAKRHGVLLSADKEQDHRTVFTQQPISLSLFSELRRFSQADLSIVEISSAEFQKTMAELYEADTSTTKETIRGIGDEFHQAAGAHSIAGSIAEATDLLEQEDEAPIIRLINAILSEAIQGSGIGYSSGNLSEKLLCSLQNRRHP